MGSMEHGGRGARLSLIKSTSLHGVPDMNVMVCWDFSGEEILCWKVQLDGQDGIQTMIGGLWRVRKSV